MVSRVVHGTGKSTVLVNVVLEHHVKCDRFFVLMPLTLSR